MKNFLEKLSILSLTLFGAGLIPKFGKIIAYLASFFVLFLDEYYRVEIILLIIVISLIAFIISYLYINSPLESGLMGEPSQNSPLERGLRGVFYPNWYDNPKIVLHRFIGILIICASPFYINEIQFLILTILIFEILSGFNLFPKKYFNNKKGLIKILGVTLVNSLYTSIIIHVLTAGWRILSLIFIVAN
jgi:hypothetical protein